MRRWIWMVLVVALISVAAYVFINKRPPPGADSAATATSSTPPPNSDAAPSDAGTRDALPAATAVPPASQTRGFGDRQKPVPGKLKDVIDELAPRAEAGDALAAHQLFIKINDCKWAMDASTEARATADEATQAAEKARLSEALARLESCEGITQDLIDSRAKWLTMAADNGDTLAQLTYASSSSLILGGAAQMMANPRAVEDFKRKSLNFLMPLAERGNVSAILQLCNAYETGVLVPEDRVRAFAYAYLANLITGRSQNLVEVIGRNLTVEQQQQGQQIAISLHRRCCG